MVRQAREIFVDIRQGRFFSPPLDEMSGARAMRYVEMHPQRAGLVTTPEAWAWSSAACHLQGTRLPGATFPPDDMLSNWSAFLLQEELPGTLDTIRHCTASGRPLGDAAFYTRLEALARIIHDEEECRAYLGIIRNVMNNAG